MSDEKKSSRKGWWVAAVVLVTLYFFVWPAYQRGNIERVLRADRGVTLAAAKDVGLSDVVWDQSTTVGKVVAGMQSIDLSGCPSDFKEAYERHIAAWAQYQQVANSYGGFNGFFKGFVTGGVAAYSAWSEGTEAQQSIAATYQHVLHIAKQYGANPPN